jgi:hypothetical protein
MKINVTTILAIMLVFASSQCVWADTAKPLVNQKEWDEAVELPFKDSNPKLAPTSA